MSTGTPVESKSFTYGNANWRDQLTAVDGVAIAYDQIGNPLNDGEWTYTWENGRQLARMQSIDTDASFVYNENGLRVQKTVNGVVTKYTLHGKNIHHMTQGDNELHFFYDASNKLAVVVYNGVPYSYVKNLQGDIVAILDSNGAVVVSYVYDAWGRPISKTGTLASTLGTVQPFRYRGYVYDEETALYYLRSRYFKTYLCRFFNEDSIVNGNMFAYCANNPVGAEDPTGYKYEKDLERMYSPIDINYSKMDSSKNGVHDLTSKMTAEEFCVHLWRAYKDPKWKYTYGHAQYRDTDCVGLYKAIMEWYYDEASFDNLTEITPGGNKFNQVKDLVRFGIRYGEDGLNTICKCCDLPPVGAAVFCYVEEEEGNKNYDRNRGWTHVGYYVGNGIVIEAESARTGIVASSIYDPKWDCWGYLKGIDYQGE